MNSVSIIIPTFNRAGVLTRAINSAFCQIAPGDEILVVDDASTDDTALAVKSFPEPVRYLKVEKGGAGRARNIGIQSASNELVAFLDSDDEWMPHKLLLQRQLMTARPDVLFSFSDFAATDERGTLVHNNLKNWHVDRRSWDEILGPGVRYSEICPLPHNINDFKFYIGDLSPSELSQAYVLTSTLVARRDAAGEALHFAEDVETFEDLECFGRLSLKGPACFLETETAIQHGDSKDRLSRVDSLRKTASYRAIVERVWGSDEAFRQRHAQLYDHTLEIARLSYIADLLHAGLRTKAREELTLLTNPPTAYRALALLPGAFTKNALRLRRRIKLASS